HDSGEASAFAFVSGFLPSPKTCDRAVGAVTQTLFLKNGGIPRSSFDDFWDTPFLIHPADLRIP
ncbi:hypothetical protein, partial [Paenibacillus xanthanilyticus]|uniref:hypothetical protein n=1 Tax=Paenibacillus xanthanilyticus TaxID=1783531 RepID=UPI003636EE47